jgi:hypothetical protein
MQFLDLVIAFGLALIFIELAGRVLSKLPKPRRPRIRK